MMAANVLTFDRRAVHRVISEPQAMDMMMDVDALAQEAIAFLEPAHLLALGTGDRSLVRGISVAHSKLVQIRDVVHEGAALVSDSLRVDPYAVLGPEAA